MNDETRTLSLRFLATGSMFTMIDTPGFGDDLENEERTIDELVDVLKNKVARIFFFCRVSNYIVITF